MDNPWSHCLNLLRQVTRGVNMWLIPTLVAIVGLIAFYFLHILQEEEQR